jgi:hypothetical protein
MLLVHAREPIPQIAPSIFLAGPTPRSQAVKSWRGEATQLLGQHGFDGMVLIPEPADGMWHEDYDAQIEWETEGLDKATCILFWIPRDMVTLPGLTTNDEWGYWKTSGKVVLGFPPHAVKVRYQEYYAKKHGIPCHLTLDGTVASAIEMSRGDRLDL